MEFEQKAGCMINAVFWLANSKSRDCSLQSRRYKSICGLSIDCYQMRKSIAGWTILTCRLFMSNSRRLLVNLLELKIFVCVCVCLCITSPVFSGFLFYHLSKIVLCYGVDESRNNLTLLNKESSILVPYFIL
jgi:hypothetical protein